MTPEQYQRAKRLFAEASDLTGNERREFVERSAGDDQEVRKLLEDLLAADGDGNVPDESELVGHGVRVLAAEVADGQPHEAGVTQPMPERIGPYKILDILGEGGMGVVYLAEQSEPIKRQVALKLIKLGMDTREVIARFESERQALAVMNHPNVAGVLDAGSTEQGRPYFVMEHVPGIRITEYCDQHCLDTKQRLGLFAQVCHAVQHAHQKGIIHRDLKPSNVLVAVREGRSVPKVIDFGVAKAIQKRLTERTLFTEQGQLIGTPEYMSPEQADTTALDIDTRTDVYSLGVLLYELLAGTLPFEPASLRRAAFGEIQRLIREQEPPRPSTRLSRLGDESGIVAAKRRTNVASLQRQLRGDLDWITMKAMDKDRTRRYATASELADDIARHLKNEPVLAGPPGTGYRLRKFARRNRGPLIATGIVLLALIAGTVGTTIGLVQAVKARDQAQLQMEMTQSINDFLNNDLLAAVSPEQQGKDVRMRDVLDAASKAIEGKFDDAPLIEASVRSTLGSTYEKLGEYDMAEPHRTAALSLRQAELGAEHAGTLAALNNLANLYRKQGRFEEAEPLLVRLLDIRRRELGEEHTDTLISMNNLANLYSNLGRYEKAESLYARALEHRRRILGEEHTDTLIVMNNLAGVYDDLGQFDKAEPLYLKTLEIRRRVLGEEHPHTLVSMNNMAVLYFNQGRLDEAETLSAETLELRRRILGDAHPLTLGSIDLLALVLQRKGRIAEAESLILTALDARRRVLGAEHPDTLNSMNNLAVLYENEGRLDEARALHEETLKHRRALLGNKHVQTMISMNNLGALYWKQGRVDEAGALFKEAFENRLVVLGSEHPATHQVGVNLVEFYKAKGRIDLVRSLAGDILAGYRAKAILPDASAKALGDYAWELCTTLAEELRDPPAALEFANKAVAATKEADPDKLDTLALAQHMTGDSEAAAESQKKALALLPAGPSKNRSGYESSLAKYLVAAHSFAEAESLLLKQYQRLSADTSASPSKLRDAIEPLITLYESWHTAEPDKRYDTKAAQYRAMLPAE